MCGDSSEQPSVSLLSHLTTMLSLVSPHHDEAVGSNGGDVGRVVSVTVFCPCVS